MLLLPEAIALDSSCLLLVGSEREWERCQEPCRRAGEAKGEGETGELHIFKEKDSLIEEWQEQDQELTGSDSGLIQVRKRQKLGWKVKKGKNQVSLFLTLQCRALCPSSRHSINAVPVKRYIEVLKIQHSLYQVKRTVGNTEQTRWTHLYFQPLFTASHAVELLNGVS